MPIRRISPPQYTLPLSIAYELTPPYTQAKGLLSNSLRSMEQWHKKYLPSAILTMKEKQALNQKIIDGAQQFFWIEINKGYLPLPDENQSAEQYKDQFKRCLTTLQLPIHIHLPLMNLVCTYSFSALVFDIILEIKSQTGYEIKHEKYNLTLNVESNMVFTAIYTLPITLLHEKSSTSFESNITLTFEGKLGAIDIILSRLIFSFGAINEKPLLPADFIYCPEFISYLDQLLDEVFDSRIIIKLTEKLTDKQKAALGKRFSESNAPDTRPAVDADFAIYISQCFMMETAVTIALKQNKIKKAPLLLSRIYDRITTSIGTISTLANSRSLTSINDLLIQLCELELFSIFYSKRKSTIAPQLIGLTQLLSENNIRLAFLNQMIIQFKKKKSQPVTYLQRLLDDMSAELSKNEAQFLKVDLKIDEKIKTDWSRHSSVFLHLADKKNTIFEFGTRVTGSLPSKTLSPADYVTTLTTQLHTLLDGRLPTFYCKHLAYLITQEGILGVLRIYSANFTHDGSWYCTMPTGQDIIYIQPDFSNPPQPKCQIYILRFFESIVFGDNIYKLITPLPVLHHFELSWIDSNPHLKIVYYAVAPWNNKFTEYRGELVEIRDEYYKQILNVWLEKRFDD